MASAVTPGLIVLGNSGVGKSFLANRLLDDDEAFESRFSARSVTRHTEWKDTTTAIGKYIYSVANIPGLIEANQKLIDENRREIMNAFEKCPFAIVLFVFGHKHGRIPDEDLVAFTRINDAYELPRESLLLIVNGIPSNRPEDYEEKAKQLLHELTNVSRNHIYFIEKAISEKSKRDIHDLLYEAVAKCEPGYHEKKHDIELVVDEISRLKMESKQRQDQLLAQEDKYSNETQKLNLAEHSTLDQHRSPSQQFLTTTMKIKPTIPNDEQQFDETMKAMKARHDQSMEELKKPQHDPNSEAIKQLTQQLEVGNEVNKKLIQQLASSPQVAIIHEKQEANRLQGVKRAIVKGVVRAGTFLGDTFYGEHRFHESEHRSPPRHDNNEHNFHSSTSPSLSPHKKNYTDN